MKITRTMRSVACILVIAMFITLPVAALSSATTTKTANGYKDGNGNLRRKVLWETVIQSPYSVDFTEQQARKQITEELLRKDENGLRMIDQIGIDGLYRKG